MCGVVDLRVLHGVVGDIMSRPPCATCGGITIGAAEWCQHHGDQVDVGPEDWQSTWKDAVRKPGLPEHLVERVEMGEKVTPKQAATDYQVTVRTAERWLNRVKA